VGIQILLTADLTTFRIRHGGQAIQQIPIQMTVTSTGMDNSVTEHLFTLAPTGLMVFSELI
jgi:hypothetical protein